MTSLVNRPTASRTSTSTSGTASTSSRAPLSELPLSLFLAPLPELTTSCSNNKEKRPSSPLKPRSLLSFAGPTAMSSPMSPAKRRLLASDMSTLQRSIRSDLEEKTPRSMGVRVVDEDDGQGRVEEDEGQKEWEGKSPARRLFVDDGGGMSASPRRHTSRTTPLLPQFTTELTPSSPHRLAPSPPISERGTPPPSSSRKSRPPGSPSTPRPTKKPRLPTSSTVTTAETSATAGPSTPPRLATSHSTTPRSSTKKRLNLLSDLEDDLFSPFKADQDGRASRAPSSTGGSGRGSRSRTLSVSVVDEPANPGTDENADPNACGFVIWNDDEDSTSGLGMDEDEIDSGRFIRGTSYPTLTSGMILDPPIGIATPAISSASIPHDDEEGFSLVEQENKPPSRAWMERKVAVAVEVSVVETLVTQTVAVGEAEESWEMMALGIEVVEKDEDVAMI